jgi:hypothetical protein
MILEPIFLSVEELGSILSWHLIAARGWFPGQRFYIDSKPDGLLITPITDDPPPQSEKSAADQKSVAEGDTSLT